MIGLETGGTQSNFLFISREARNRWRSIRCKNLINHTVSVEPCSCPDLTLDTMTDSGTAGVVSHQMPSQEGWAILSSYIPPVKVCLLIWPSWNTCSVVHLFVFIVFILKWIHPQDDQSHTEEDWKTLWESTAVCLVLSPPASCHSLLAGPSSILTLFQVWLVQEWLQKFWLIHFLFYIYKSK